MIKYLLDQPPSSRDRETPLQYFWTAPVAKATKEFMRRFDVAVSTGFGMTEIGGPIWGGDSDGSNLGAWGRLNDLDPRGYQLRLGGEHEREVQNGEVGGTIWRTAVPWVLDAGYFRGHEGH